MTSLAKSRWADDEEDATVRAQRKREKEDKKRAKAEQQRKLEATREKDCLQQGAPTDVAKVDQEAVNGETERPLKRRRISPEHDTPAKELPPLKLLRFPAPEWGPCRHVDNFEKLNHIEEGSYGWVSRAKETATGEIVALKKLKMDNANDGFPVTGLREIQTLMASKHPNIVALREVVMGDGMDE